MKRLDFINPIFRHGLNFTVRSGRKWLGVEIGEMVEIGSLAVASINTLAEIVKIYHCRFAEIPQEVYDHEHDFQCETFQGLLDAMRRAYPSEFSVDKNGEEIENQIVTCVGFHIYHSY